MAYGISTSPLGPIVVPPDNVILRQRGRVRGTGHHSVVEVPGTDRWYIFYHRHAVPNGNGYLRETCLAPLEFEADGRIKKVDPLAGPRDGGDQATASAAAARIRARTKTDS